MTVNLLLLVGISLNLLKGADLLLRPHQRKAIQGFLEDMTLRLSDMDFPTLSKRMGTSEAQFCFLVLAYAEFAFVIFINLIAMAALSRLGGAPNQGLGSQLTHMRHVQYVAASISLLTLAFCWKWPLPQVMRWVVGEGRRWSSVFIRSVLFYGQG